MIKRLLDITLSLIGLLFFLPFGIPIALILKITGERDIFYIQPRVGKEGRLFGVFKFATMLRNSPDIGGGLFTAEDDPRVFPFGKFLRKTKLNEVPQLLNVLKGDMSLVGPRPQVPAHFDPFPEHVKKELVKIKPGLTGVGSIIFRDEETILHNSGKSYEECYKEDIAPYKGDLELWYIRNQSFLLDLKIILMTVWVVLFPDSKIYQKFFPEISKKELKP